MQEGTSNHTLEEGADGPALRRVHDRAEVEELLLRYAMSVDLRDWDLFRSCFGERVHVRFEPPDADVPDGPMTPDEWAVLAGRALGSAEARQHYYSIFSVRLDEEEAEAVVYYRAGRGEAVDAPAAEQSIYYTHRCRHTRAGWKIVEISTHVLPAGERGPNANDANANGEPSQVRPRRSGHGGQRREAANGKRQKRSAAKRR